MRAIKLEVREFAMLIAFRNAGRGNERISARFKAAIAAYNPAIRIRRLPPTSTTNGTNFRGNLHEQSLKRGLYFECALRELVCASTQRWKPCVHPVELWKVCGEPGRSRTVATEFFILCEAVCLYLYFYFSRLVFALPDRALLGGMIGPARAGGDDEDELCQGCGAGARRP